MDLWKERNATPKNFTSQNYCIEIEPLAIHLYETDFMQLMESKVKQEEIV